jgi:hypothetical protein
MSAWFEIDGLDELKAALRNLPAELAGEAANLVEAAGNRAVLDLRRAYPKVTGNLRAGVQVTFTKSPFGAKARVQTRAPHAHLYEYGTEARHFGLRKLKRMEPKHTYGKTMARNRREMWGEIEELLERAGLKVRGHV